MRSRAALSGSLRDLPFSELLNLLTSARHSGIIEFTGAAPGLVVLDDGAVTLALADDGPTLPQVIIGSGITSADGWERAHATASHGRMALADALVRHGASETGLEAVLHEQTVSTIFEMLLPSDTYFGFFPGATHPLGNRFRFDVHELLDRAGHRVEAWKVIAEAIPSTSVVMRLTRELPDVSITVAAEDWRVLAYVDGRNTIADVIRSLGMSAFAVCGVLHRLLLAGVVEQVPD